MERKSVRGTMLVHSVCRPMHTAAFHLEISPVRCVVAGEKKNFEAKKVNDDH